jgi:uncharacterized C2H2 Zn-finger protein
MSKSAVANREAAARQPGPNALACPHCDFIAVRQSGLTLHLNKSHKNQTTRRELAKTIEARPISTSNGHHHEAHPTVSIPEANDGTHRLEAIATLATGRIQQVIEGLAFTHDLPPRSLTSLVIRTLGQASKIW